MPNSITTSGTTPAVSTKSLPGEAPNSWVARHSESVENATPTGNTLTTTWYSTNGRQTTTTTREQDESDEDFLLRHIQDYAADMIDEPPVP